MTSGRWLRRRSRTTSQRLPTAPAFSSYAPNTSLATRASTIAPAHIVQGSRVTSGVPQRDDLGVTGRVVVSFADVASVADDLAGRVDHQRTDGDVAGRQRGPR